MKIRIWNAFASNNSGSYTLVGTFPSPERAAEVVGILAPLLAAQTRWVEEGGERPSPLERLAIAEMLAWEGDDEQWPEYSHSNTPEIAAVGEQVLLHHPYTVTLPRLFGHFVYARGGSVDATLDHAHHPLVAVFEVHWAWTRPEAEIAEQKRSLRARLEDPSGPLAAATKEGVAPVVRALDDWMRPFLVAAVFEDLVAGVAAVQRAIEQHEGRSRLRLTEAFDEQDPLAPVRLALPGD